MVQALFSFAGRIRRLSFVGHLLLALLLVLPLQLLAFLLRTRSPAATMLLETIGTVFLWWSGLALIIKRLHDMNRSGVVLLWYLLALALGSGLALVSTLHPDNTLLFEGSVLTLTIGNFAFNMWLLFTPGTPGTNRFGPSRRALDDRMAAEPFAG